MVKYGAFGHKIENSLENSKYQRTSKLLHWFKIYGDFGEQGDFTYWRSCLGKGLSLQPAQQACLALERLVEGQNLE